MAGNKFATVLHRSANRMGVVLVYTVLEWILISLLLLNALFSYLIARFAAFFGLKPPCILCSRLDHLLVPDVDRCGSYRGLICDDHAAHISRLAFCPTHRRLAEASEMCEDCWSAAGDRTPALPSWMKLSEEGLKDLRCSCCDVSLESGFYSPYLLLRSSCENIPEDAREGESVDERVEEGCVAAVENDDEILGSRGIEDAEVVLLKRYDAAEEGEEEKVADQDEGEPVALVADQEHEQEKEDEEELQYLSCDRSLCLEDRSLEALFTSLELQYLSCDRSLCVEDGSLEVLTMSLDADAAPDDDRLIPVDLIDSETMNVVELIESETIKIPESSQLRDEGDDGEFGVCEAEPADANISSASISEEEVALWLTMEMEDEVDSVTIGAVEFIEECASVPKPADDSTREHAYIVPQAGVVIPHDGDEVAVESRELTKDLGEPVSIEVESLGVAKDLGEPVSNEVESLGVAKDLGEPVSIEVESLGVAEDLGEPVSIEVESLGVAEDLAEPQGLEEDTKVVDSDANCEVSIGSEICDQEQIEQAQLHEPIPLSRGIENQCSQSYTEQVNVDQVHETEQLETAAQPIDHLRICTELNEVEEERVPDTPTTPIYIEGIHTLHKRFLFERRESGTESIDGSIASEIEGTEPLTVDHLKASLKVERKVLSALYVELEEERSASAIAASQTMAMITRLQEEKAAMQMEALQYQRMMEEQSEYDQEALQLLNELMMKREKEKQELEKELDIYRKKVLLYESREKTKIVRGKANGRSGTSSASSSAEDSDDLSFDINGCDEYSDGLQESNQNIPADTVLGSETDQETTKHLITLDESLADFEEERLAILEQLRALEEKLFTMDAEEPSANKEFAENLSEENGHGMNGHYESSGNEVNGLADSLLDDIDPREKLYSDRKSMGYRGKRLLPLFDAISLENEEELGIAHEATDTSPDSVSKLAMVQKKLAIAEEVDNVYERLQALEADREFLKHCIRSLKKGDKGMYLLQEILQHLRDLRAVELRVRNADDALASL